MEIEELGVRIEATPAYDDEEKMVDVDDELRCARLHERFAAMRREDGPSQAVRRWFAPMLSLWLTWLDDPDFDELDVDARTLCALAVTLTDSLAMRDAMIIAMIIDPALWDEETLTEFAVRPHAPRTGTRMGALLTEAFDDPAAAPDRGRVQRGSAVLRRTVDIVPDAFSAQPLATAAYGAWWIGDPDALRLAMEALALDDDASLAGIVVAAVLRAVSPVWCRAGGDGDGSGDA